MTNEQISAPTFAEALRFWLKLGLISFGGPAGQIAIMQTELVEKKRWIDGEKFAHALNFCMFLPGPEAQQLATYCGWLLHGTRGGLAAGVLFVFPAVFVLLALSAIYVKFGGLPSVGAIFGGLQAVVIAIIASAAWKIGQKSCRTLTHILFAVFSFAAVYFLRVPFPLVVACAAAGGFLLLRAPKVETEMTENSAEMSCNKSFPVHLFKVFGIFLGVWLTIFALCRAFYGADGLPTQLFLFFTKTAFVTFGGAYAVLAYVNQAAVEQFGWISATQAIDGFALAETTPGPLIMVLQFVGFTAGWNVAEDDASRMAFAVVCGLVTTLATFLPSFLFIFAFAPYVEKIRRNRQIKSALEGVSSAVVGVIISLTVSFSTKIFAAPNQVFGVDWFALAIASAAFAVLKIWRWDVLWVIFGGALAGLVRGFL